MGWPPWPPSAQVQFRFVWHCCHKQCKTNIRALRCCNKRLETLAFYGASSLAMLASKLAFLCSPSVHRCCRHLAVVHTQGRSLTVGVPCAHLVSGSRGASFEIVPSQADRRASHSQATTSAVQSSSDLALYPSGRHKSPLHVTAATQQASAATATGGR